MMDGHQNPKQFANIRPTGPATGEHNYPTLMPGVPAQVPPPTEQGSQWKGPLPPQGQVPGSTSQPVNARFGINGFSATQNTQPPPPPPGTGAQGQMFMNGPSVGQPSHFSLTNRPPRPAVLQNPGQFQPSQPPSAVGLNRPPVMPSFVQPGQPGSTGPPPSHFGHPGQSASDSTSEAERPNELPVPFRGQGQYSHQVGLALTPGITPIHSGPSSLRSSNTNSPVTVNPSLDALEGQFRNTPDQDTESSEGSDRTPSSDVEGRSTQWNQPPAPAPSFQTSDINSGPQRFPAPGNQPGPSSTQPQFPMPNTSGMTAFHQPSGGSGQASSLPPSTGPHVPTPGPSQRPGFPPASANQQPGFQPVSGLNQQPRFPMPPVSANQQPGLPVTTANQRPAFPPAVVPGSQQPPFSRPPGPDFASQRFPVSSSQQPGYLGPVSTNQQPGFAPVSTSTPRPGVPPSTATNQQPGFPPMAGSTQRSGFPPGPSTGVQQPGSAPQRPGFPQGPSTGVQQPGSAPQRPGFTPGPPTGVQQPGLQGMSTSQRPGFPPAPSTASQQPGFPPLSAANQRPGFPPPLTSANQVHGFQPVSTAGVRPGFPPPLQQPGFPPAPSSTNQQPGFPPPISASQQPGFPPHSSVNQQPGFPPMSTPSQRPGFPPPPVSANQMPGFPPPPVSANQMPGFPPPPVSSNQMPGFPPPPVSAYQQPGMPPTSSQPRPGFPPTNFTPGVNQQPGFNTGTNQFNQGPGPGQFNQMPPGQKSGKSIQEFVNTRPATNAINSSMGSMSIQPGNQMLNLMQVKNLIPREGVEVPKPNIPNDNKKVNCSPEVFRCTLNAIPQTSGLLNKARLPLGILIHPFKDLSSLPVIQSSVIVRCRSCRTYINPFVYFVDTRRWKCNLCYRVNELPDEFSFDPVTKTYGDPQRRPEIRSATIEFIAPSEYMLRPPQPAVYLYLLDVSFNAVETGYLNVFCETLLDVLEKIPGDSRTQIGFIAYDSAVHFFNLAEGLSQPQMLTVSDVEDVFLPCPDSLLVNFNECKDLVVDLLNQLPNLFEGNTETGSALGAALQAGYKMTSSIGARITVMQTILPTVGPGALQNREDATHKASKDVPNLGPAIDFYKKLALDCSAQQIAVDLFMFNSQYADMASIECISKFSGGCIYYYPMFHHVGQPHLAEKFEIDLRRYLTRKIGFESVMRIRCSKGLTIHTFHGNFFVRSTDLLSLPNINPDAGFGMQMSIEESLTDMSTMCFQAALLYTSSKGERRIRVHTLCLPVTNQLSEIYASADQQAIVALVAKMAVDRCITSSMSDAREAIVNAAIDVLNAYGNTLTAAQKMGNLCINDTLRLMPLYCLALLKSRAFRVGVSTRLDDRVYALEQCKTLPTSYLIQMLYPDLYPVHTIMEVEMVKKGSQEVPDLPLLQLSSANIDRFGAYILDTGETIYLYLGSAINEQFCKDILDKPNFASLQEGGMTELPELENEGSERLRSFLTYLLDNRPNGASFILVREDGKHRMQFFQHFVEDRTESSMSYYEFLQHIQKQVKS